MNIMMWENDSFKKCHPSALSDLRNYIEMRERGFRTVSQWDEIKHFHVTEAFRTIWSLTEDSFKDMFEHGKPIGQEQPTLTFIKQIYEAIHHQQDRQQP